MSTFQTLPDLPAGTPCRAVAPDEIDLADMEYTPFALPIQSADTMREQLNVYRQALEPFANVGKMYRQNGEGPNRMILSVCDSSGEAVVSVQDFIHAADVLK